jgi:hypothetical protein
MADQIPVKVGMLEENPGETSTMRVGMMGTVVCILGVFGIANILNWINCFLHGKDVTIIDFPIYAVGILTAVVTGKVVQKFAEK